MFFEFQDTCVKEAIADLAAEFITGAIDSDRIDKTPDDEWIERWGDMGFTVAELTQANVAAAVRNAAKFAEAPGFDVEDGMDESAIKAALLGY